MYNTIAVIILVVSHLNEHLKNAFGLQKLHLLNFVLTCITQKGKTKSYFKKTKDIVNVRVLICFNSFPCQKYIKNIFP